MATVRIPTQMRNLVDGASTVEVEGDTVGAVLRGLADTHASIASRLFEEDGRVRLRQRVRRRRGHPVRRRARHQGGPGETSRCSRRSRAANRPGTTAGRGGGCSRGSGPRSRRSARSRDEVAVLDGQHERRRDEHRQQVIAAVADRAMRVAERLRAEQPLHPSSRSASEPDPVSISATPQVACGRKTWSGPAPPPAASVANRSISDVMSVTKRPRVSTSSCTDFTLTLAVPRSPHRARSGPARGRVRAAVPPSSRSENRVPRRRRTPRLRRAFPLGARLHRLPREHDRSLLRIQHQRLMPGRVPGRRDQPQPRRDLDLAVQHLVRQSGNVDPSGTV